MKSDWANQTTAISRIALSQLAQSTQAKNQSDQIPIISAGPKPQSKNSPISSPQQRKNQSNPQKPAPQSNGGKSKNTTSTLKSSTSTQNSPPKCPNPSKFLSNEFNQKSKLNSPQWNFKNTNFLTPINPKSSSWEGSSSPLEKFRSIISTWITLLLQCTCRILKRVIKLLIADSHRRRRI